MRWSKSKVVTTIVGQKSNSMVTVRKQCILLTMTFVLLTLKLIEGHPRVIVNTCVKYHHCMPKGDGRIAYGKKFYVRIWPWPLTFWPHKSITVLLGSWPTNAYMKYHHFKSKWKGVIVQKPLFHWYIVIVKQVNTLQHRLRGGYIGYNNKSNET